MKKTLIAPRLFLVSLLALLSTPLFAQTPAPAAPTPTWTGNFGAGLALTSGNTDTRNYNLAFETVRDAKKKTVFRLKSIYLRGEEKDLLTVNRLTIVGRDEIKMTDRLFLFVQGDYTKDTFKQIDYVVSPSGGVGYTLVKTDRTQFAVDAGAGGIWERDIARPTFSSGAVNASERFALKLSKTATLSQAVDSVWKTNNWSDSLQNFTVGVAASLTARTELKFQFLDSYKNLPPPGPITVKKNDTTIVSAFVFKF